MRILLSSLLVVGMVTGCSGAMVPDTSSSLRARMDPQLYSSEGPDSAISLETKVSVLDAVKKQLLRNGRYPKTAVQNSEILSIERVARTFSQESYIATVRTPWAVSSVDMTFLIYEKEGEWIVRKASI